MLVVKMSASKKGFISHDSVLINDWNCAHLKIDSETGVKTCIFERHCNFRKGRYLDAWLQIFLSSERSVCLVQTLCSFNTTVINVRSPLQGHLVLKVNLMRFLLQYTILKMTLPWCHHINYCFINRKISNFDSVLPCPAEKCTVIVEFNIENGLPWWLSGEESTCQFSRCSFISWRREWSWVGKIPWRRERQPTRALLPGESHGQRSLVGHSPWCCKSRTWLRD